VVAATMVYSRHCSFPFSRGGLLSAQQPRHKPGVAKSRPAGPRTSPTADHSAPLAGSFAAQLKPLVPPPDGDVALATLLSAPLAHLSYEVELQVKNQGLTAFWKHHRLPGQPEPVVASPRPRGYRTTSRRKAVLRGVTLCLFFGDKTPLPQQEAFLPSPLEPEEHGAIYRFLQQKLSEPAFRLLAAHLNYLIIRGSYAEQAVIFNVDKLDGPLVRKLKIVAEHLRKLAVPVAAAFVFFDPSRSDYYLESRRPDDTLHFKKLFGVERLAVAFEDCRYLFHPTSFSQVNAAMVPVLLRQARALLHPAPDQYLLDLYCGYGLFSHFLASDCKQVLGIDAGGAAIRAAVANGRFNSKRGGHVKFLAHRITGGFLGQLLSSSAAPAAVLLDPPRQGPQAGVIAALCGARPQVVLHIFCGADQIPAALTAWRAGGYEARRIVPLDMFPGTVNLEVLILLAPKGKSN